MATKLSRRELYELVWSEPMKTLAARFERSDVALAKACKRADIPRPPRGYWAKLKAGKKVSLQPLPARGPGMADEVTIGGGSYWGYYVNSVSDEEILNSVPQPPGFEDEIEDVANRVRPMVGQVAVPRTMAKAHRQIKHLLDADEGRRLKQLNSRFAFSWEKPLFDDPFEKRRLRFLNAIFVALERCRMKPLVRGQHARDLSVRVNDTNVYFKLDATSQKHDPYHGATIETRGPSKKLRFEILSSSASSNVRMVWEDDDDEPLERSLDDIVTELIVSAERQYREACQRRYEWRVERKARLIEEIRKRKEEAERQERERQIRLEKERVERLRRDASALRQADEIRAYVEAVRIRCNAESDPQAGSELENWAKWALAQADRIDPLISKRFLESINDTSETRKSDGKST